MKKILLLSTTMFLLSIAIFAQEPDGRKYFYIYYSQIDIEKRPRFYIELRIITNVFYIDKEDCNSHYVGLEFSTFVKDYYIKEGLKSEKDGGSIYIKRFYTKEAAEEDRRKAVRDSKSTIEEKGYGEIIYVDDFNPTCNRIKLNQQ